MNTRSRLLAALALLTLSAAGPGAHAADAPAMAKDGVLVTPAGMTLYTFDKDPADATRSMCNGPCANNWPPLAADKSAAPTGDWKPIARDDGGMQWSYKGKPLYTWSKDQKPGDRSGDGMNGVWHTAAP